MTDESVELTRNLINALLQASASLQQSTNQQNDKLDGLIDNIDALIEQVGRLTEGLTELKLITRSILEAINTQSAVTTTQANAARALGDAAKEQGEASKIQAQNVDRLTRLLETLILQKASSN
jgi:hypothetical protein